MSYINATLLSILKKIETRQICLPSIQRKFEWDMNRIEMLFDSILNDYPIGTFLIWEVTSERISDYKFYEINSDFDLNVGRWQRPRTNNTTYSELWAMLDGQQRLSSLSIGLQGSYSYLKGKKAIKKYLYFNMIKPEGANEEFKSFKFFAEGEEQKDPDNIWIKSSLFVKTLDFLHNQHSIEKPKYNIIKDIIAGSIKHKNDELKELYHGWESSNNYFIITDRAKEFAQRIAKNETFSYYKIKEGVDLDVCNEIFVRINSGGVKLSKADLLFSTVVSAWENGRYAIDELIKRLKNNGFIIDSDFVMRTCLYLVHSNILFKVETFNQSTVNKIINSFEDNENETGISTAIIKTFDFLRLKLGIQDKILKSKNVIIPIIHHVYHGGKLDDYSIEEIQKYLYISLLQKIFGSHGDTLLTDLRKGVTNITDADYKYDLEGRSFDFKKLISKVSEQRKRELYNVNTAWIERILNYEKGSESWLVLSLIYGKLQYDYMSYDQDHLHPVSGFKKNKYKGDIESALGKKDTIPNLCFSTPEDNRLKKNAHPLHYYLEKILQENNINWYRQYRSFNKIDNEISLDLENFESFYAERKNNLVNILKQKLDIDDKNTNDDKGLMNDDEYPDIDPDSDLEVNLSNYLDDTNNSEDEELIFKNENINSDKDLDSNKKPNGFSFESNKKVKELYSLLIKNSLGFLSGNYSTDQIYTKVKDLYPDLCDDNYLCINNCIEGNKQPEWKHRVRTTLNSLKRRGTIRYDNSKKEFYFK